MGNREYKERKEPRRRNKKSHRIYAFIVLSLAAAIIAAVIFLLFYVQKIEVKGTEYVTEKEIIDIMITLFNQEHALELYDNGT